MKLLYTDISTDMTKVLSKEAQEYARQGKRVFYLAPNSLSFEKERKVLEELPNQASFGVTITRFAQLARYFTLTTQDKKEAIDDVGLAMIFYRVLSQFSDEDLRIYGRLRKDMAFIQQLVDLYKELKTAHISLLDLEALEDEKSKDLVTIFSAVTRLLAGYNMETESKLALFGRQIEAGNLDKALKDTVLVIDGFTRFSAEEAYLVHLLSQKCSEVVIGTYASQKAYSSPFSYGNVYQAPLDFLRQLAATYAVKPIYVTVPSPTESAFSAVTTSWEGLHDFTERDQPLEGLEQTPLAIWSVLNQKEEVEWVARSIRQLLADGVRYKDILVLLGDVESYQLQISKLFDKFDIPFYLGKAEPMANHPLVHFVDSLERVYRYNYRAEDVLNLLKSGLFGSFSEMEIDRFDQYVTYALIKGRKQFAKDFTIRKKDRYDLESLNQMRQTIVSSLESFLSLKEKTGKELLLDLERFLHQVRLPENMALLAANQPEAEKEKDHQVWSVFSDLLMQIETIFADEKMEVADFLALLRSGMLAAEYRTVPATVDVVNIKSYDLVEPHSSPYVFALGMTKGHFPKISQNKSLLTDEERQKINEATDEFSAFEISSQENSKKNHFTALSLFMSATKQLVLSYPQVLNENEDDVSVYIKELAALGFVIQAKSAERFQAKGKTIGHYKDLLGTVLALHQGALDREFSQEEHTFWAVASRYLSKRLAKEDVLLPDSINDIQTSKVSDEVMAIRFPKEEPLSLSVSALTTFYTNQYLYFLRYVLGLKELETIQADSRHHGQYLHKVFELALIDDGTDFDRRLEKAMKETASSEEFALFYNQDEEGRYSKYVLDRIAKSTASVLTKEDRIELVSQEERFDLMVKDAIRIQGIIDRVDRLKVENSLGVVDYKSGATQFDIQKFYNGLHSQLVTYLHALNSRYQVGVDQLFGAMYLHMKEPKLELKTALSLEELASQAHTELRYKGIFADKEKGFLAEGAYHLTNSIYTEEELALLLHYNEQLFEEAARTIRQGHFLINPYTTDGRSVQGQQEKSITHFEADRHMGQARRIVTGPSRGKKDIFLGMIKDQLDKEGSDEA